LIDPSEFSIWYPETDENTPVHERSASFLEYCLKVKPRDGMALRSDFSLETLKPWLGNIMILEFDPAREDFRYRLYGSEIASRTGFEMTGKWVADLGPDVGDILREQYLRAIREKRLVLCRNPYVHSRAPCDWERVVCPVADGERSEEHTSELQPHHDLVCRLLLEKKKSTRKPILQPETMIRKASVHTVAQT